jgi:hypothetical protein
MAAAACFGQAVKRKSVSTAQPADLHYSIVLLSNKTKLTEKSNL